MLTELLEGLDDELLGLLEELERLDGLLLERLLELLDRLSLWLLERLLLERLWLLLERLERLLELLKLELLGLLLD